VRNFIEGRTKFGKSEVVPVLNEAKCREEQEQDMAVGKVSWLYGCHMVINTSIPVAR
jgi:hypothetical protein